MIINILRIRTGLSAPRRISYTLDLTLRPNELQNICGAGIQRSVGTAIMPYSELTCYPCENQTQNPRKDAILAVVLP